MFVEAIETCPSESTEELAQFYQNRAAAWESLVRYTLTACAEKFTSIIQKNYAKVIDDCSKAIELNPKYIKCIQRRARAAETIENFELALEGTFYL